MKLLSYIILVLVELLTQEQQIAQEAQAAQQQAAMQSLVGQTGQIAGTPMMDPSKNPEGTAALGDQINEMSAEQQAQPPQE